MFAHNMEAETHAFFGYNYYDLPGNANEAAQGEERHDSIFSGYDPALKQYESVTVTYSDGSTETRQNLSLDEYQQLQAEKTAYNPDTSTTDLEHNTVTVYGGAEYFVSLQNTAPGRNEKEISDCQTFAAMVDTMANNSASRREFLDNMARTFTSANNSGIREMRNNSGGPLVPPRPSFGSSGFKSQFKDPSNQVRHFVGGFIAGANLGWLPAKTFMNSRETAGVDDPDIALNEVSTQLGADTIGHGIGYVRKNTANDIRTKVCE
jgi:hypothetical protein